MKRNAIRKPYQEGCFVTQSYLVKSAESALIHPQIKLLLIAFLPEDISR